MLTGSTLAVGLLAAVEFVPILLLALVGGALADSFDRRRLMQGAEVASLLAALALVANATRAEPRVALLFVAAVVSAAASAIRRPPMDALCPGWWSARSSRPQRPCTGRWWTSPAWSVPRWRGLVVAGAGFATAYAVDAPPSCSRCPSLARDADPTAAAVAERPERARRWSRGCATPPAGRT